MLMKRKPKKKKKCFKGGKYINEQKSTEEKVPEKSSNLNILLSNVSNGIYGVK